MRILFLTNNSTMYGANRSLLSLIEFLKKEFIEVIVLCPYEGEFVEELSRKDIECIIYPFYESCFIGAFKASIRSFVNILTDFLKFKRLIRLGKEINPDIIYTNTSVLYHGYFLAKRLGKKHIWHLREFGSKDYNLYHPLGLNYFRKLLLKSSAVISISKSIEKFYRLTNIKNAFVIYNGLSNEKHKYISRSLDKEGELKKIKLLAIGYLTNNKGQFEAILAFENLLKIDKRFELTIVGGGDKNYLNKVKGYCMNNEILKDVVFFKGHQYDVQSFYKSADYFLMYSKNEAFGRVTVEAMLNGLPIIGYKSGGTEELVKHSFNGFLFEKYDTSLTDIYKNLIDAELYRNISNNAFQFAINQYSESKYCNRILRLIHNLSD